MVLGNLKLSAAQIFLVSLEMGFYVHEFVEQLIVLQNLDVLHMEVGLVVSLESLVWLARVDALEDAQLSKVLQRHLKSSNGI